MMTNPHERLMSVKQALAIVYLQNQDLLGKTPTEIFEIYHEAEREISKAEREIAKVEREISKTERETSSVTGKPN